MGFPAFSVMTPSGNRAFPKPDKMDEVLWKGTHERLYLYESDAEKFILNTTNVYDMIFIDAYDGDDIFPHALWDPDSLFLKALSNQLQPEHGTVVVNLHSDSDLLNPDGSVPSVLEQVLPMGKYVSKVGRAYKDVLTQNTSSSGGKTSGLGFTVSVPWGYNLGNPRIQIYRSGSDSKLTILLFAVYKERASTTAILAVAATNMSKFLT
ncbi:hypothetical protein TIFTF001_051959 [Ficus carica]|uniref:Uncharacterized protein n=1 Tax=Ficus carica TaxID=3494 RepID=A0AA88ECG9_FICCA|nr:hypothetical protein TIFTF001_051952 [Ficus carica]GMN72189.1 hypothetical protein TIFTF001_051955 [Ficus carica]GMN72192.1 hypothetical protein TIFTF001_051956 [Ficus carica]GMN72201.1 hypothetical protein TIFTF001_051959 [Ficus carica]